jgi:CheY-like chemotaxis protein
MEAHRFDLVIVDFVMPKMLGDEFTRRVRQHENHAVRAIPVLGLSGSHEEAEALFTEAGVSAYVRKPLHDEHLLDAVRRLLPVSARRSEPRAQTA